MTPVLGNISSGCCEASRQYITLLGEAASSLLTVTDKQRAALRMLDSNGPLPFLQEGMLQVMIMEHDSESDEHKNPFQDTVPVDVCDVVSGFIDSVLNNTGITIGSNILCKVAFHEEVRVIGKLPKQIRTPFELYSLIYRSSIWSC